MKAAPFLRRLKPLLARFPAGRPPAFAAIADDARPPTPAAGDRAPPRAADLARSLAEVPVREASPPENRPPENRAPENRALEPGVPENCAPETRAPENRVPEPGVPEPGVPEPGVPEPRPAARPWLSSVAGQLRWGAIAWVGTGLLATGGIALYTSLNAHRAQALALQATRARAAADRVDAYVRDLERGPGYLARTRGLTDLPEDVQLLLLEGLLKHNAAYELAGLTDENAQIRAGLTPRGPLTVADWAADPGTGTAAARAIQLQTPQTAPAVLDPDSGFLVASIAVPARDRENAVGGALVTRVNLEFLNFILSETQVGRGGHAYAIDRRFRLLADGSRRAPGGVLQDLSDRSELSALLTQDGTQLQTYRGLRGEPVLGAVAPVGQTGWSVVVELPLAEVYGPVYTLAWKIAGSIAAILLATLAIGATFTARRIVRPLQTLTRAAGALRDGHLEARATLSARNEFGLLAAALNEMADRLQSSFADLEEKNRALEASMTQLQATHLQLIQSEKMSTLGQLVAGIAHEINNPTNFIHGNLTHLETYFDDLFAILDACRDRGVFEDPEVADRVAAADLEFMAQDVPKILRSLQVGTSRIREIVLGLRNFARLDESGRKTVDIHEGLDNALMLLQHELKSDASGASIEVSRRYGVVPKATCYPGQLNQAVLNLLANAIDALRERADRDPDFQPRLSVSTRPYELDWVEIEIADNGDGIPESARNKLFDPFFTTKPVGEGTGLGLSIAYQIVVDRHGGTLTFDSQPGQGTTFRLRLPSGDR